MFDHAKLNFQVEKFTLAQDIPAHSPAGTTRYIDMGIYDIPEEIKLLLNKQLINNSSNVVMLRNGE